MHILDSIREYPKNVYHVTPLTLIDPLQRQGRMSLPSSDSASIPSRHMRHCFSCEGISVCSDMKRTGAISRLANANEIYTLLEYPSREHT
jgi:hypothetical protein